MSIQVGQSAAFKRIFSDQEGAKIGRMNVRRNQKRLERMKTEIDERRRVPRMKTRGQLVRDLSIYPREPGLVCFSFAASLCSSGWSSHDIKTIDRWSMMSSTRRSWASVAFCVDASCSFKFPSIICCFSAYPKQVEMMGEVINRKNIDGIRSGETENMGAERNVGEVVEIGGKGVERRCPISYSTRRKAAISQAGIVPVTVSIVIDDPKTIENTLF